MTKITYLVTVYNEIKTVEKAIKDPSAYLASSSDYNKKLVEDPEYLICHLALSIAHDRVHPRLTLPMKRRLR